MLKSLKKDTTDVFRRYKSTSKVRRMYLEFKKLKISGEWETKWLKTKKQSTTEIFRS